jgi:hypothetical protein
MLERTIGEAHSQEVIKEKTTHPSLIKENPCINLGQSSLNFDRTADACVLRNSATRPSTDKRTTKQTPPKRSQE